MNLKTGHKNLPSLRFCLIKGTTPFAEIHNAKAAAKFQRSGLLAAGVPQGHVARHFGVSQSTISRLS
jgi:hypothetical protein